MNILQHPVAMNERDIQIWKNAAPENEESKVSATTNKCSWSNFQPCLVNLSSESLESEYSKENVSPLLLKTPVCVKSSQPIQPLHPNSAIGRSSHGKPLKLLFKEGLLEPFSEILKEKDEVQEERDVGRDEKKIDMEIKGIEKEMSRLSSRLEALRLEKADQNMKTIEKGGRIVPAKFMEPKQSNNNSEGVKKTEQTLASSTKTKPDRRGVSLGPTEILSGAGIRRLSKPSEITPVQSIQNRRKSCFWKLQDIDELRVTKERRKSLSVSPKSQKTVTKLRVPKQAATTVGSRKALKKEDGVLSSIQPKKLFKDFEKSVPAKKSMKTGRVIASRYNSTLNDCKESWPEDDKDESKRFNKKRLSLIGKPSGNVRESCKSQGIDSKGNKKWDIQSEVKVCQIVCGEEKPSPSVAVLPKIKILRCDDESPRDSGPAKRVAEMIGRKSYFCTNEQVEELVCQALSYAEEDK